MNPTRTREFACRLCGDLLHFEEDAPTCCGEKAIVVDAWKCSECGYVYNDDDEEQARYCCLDEEAVLPATPKQLEAAGQERLAI